MELSALAVAAVLSDELVAVFKCEQGVDTGVNAEDDASAVTAVAAVGTAVRNVFLAVERDRAVAAVACLNVNSDVIYKHILPQNTVVF